MFNKKISHGFITINGVGGQIYQKGNKIWIQFTCDNLAHADIVKNKLIEINED